ncbi:metal ABC transporter ATP-binding protein [Silicimonas algicola]|uniref:Zinc transport system ATP-binding protein n=1 Tax=Silicimonas algicola TaxID=1826607 RepID=A0A316GBY2_9RHOB|nr:metal ABC transporter ATP-binding protein [Silicimonas algicola]AZQ66065.1 metal ABC transporter ATP-binding protein [Silicimonas algicola]PWK58364.1 zinc transport system ATP-binding protein [Silicimonas algicola]
MSLLDVRDLSVRYGSHEALHDVSLSIDAGEIVTIVGPNGSGKTSLLRAIVGAVPISAGRIKRASGLILGYVPQRLHIDPTMPMTVARFLRLRRGATRDQIASSLSRAGVPDVTDRQMADLSGGQLQRVLLARALVSRPGLLLLDEPTQGLDQPGSAAFYRLIEEVRRDTGCAVLMISHELHVVMAASDRVICINGHVCCHGTPDVVSSAPEYRALFGSGTGGALALYRHDHDHAHGHSHHGHAHSDGATCNHAHPENEAAD